MHVLPLVPAHPGRPGKEPLNRCCCCTCFSVYIVAKHDDTRCLSLQCVGELAALASCLLPGSSTFANACVDCLLPGSSRCN